MCLGVCGCARTPLLVCALCMCSAHSSQNIATDLLELELQVIARQLVWVLGTVPGSSTRLASVDHWAISPTSQMGLKVISSLTGSYVRILIPHMMT